jgi:hypothetical protein
MQDDPTPAELTIAVAKFLRRDLLPSLKGHLGFQLRVSINALDLVARQLTREAAANEAESRRLVALLGHAGGLPTLNRELCEAIASGHMSLSTAGPALSPPTAMPSAGMPCRRTKRHAVIASSCAAG